MLGVALLSLSFSLSTNFPIAKGKRLLWTLFFFSIREEQKVHFVGDFKVYFSLVINLHTRSH